MKKGDALDPKGLIAEAYKIDGISKPECRSIFLDWALSVPLDMDNGTAIAGLLERHGAAGHPMTEVMRESQAQALAPKRRGGWRSRNRPS